MDGEDWTTLCPAPMADDEVWPPNHSNPGDRYGWGCVVFDTYMNYNISADDALTMVSGGSTYEHRWVPNTHGKFILGFDYDKTDGTATEMHAVGTECKNMDPSGGRMMDGDRVAPASDPHNPDNKAWSF